MALKERWEKFFMFLSAIILRLDEGDDNRKKTAQRANMFMSSFKRLLNLFLFLLKVQFM